MPPPSRLTDDLWLAAHDSVNGKPKIGDRPLGVGLATGLLAELVHGKHLKLQEGELFRTGAWLPDDPALRPVLVAMEVEERSWPTPDSPGPATRAWADARERLPGATAWTRPGQHSWNPPPLEEGRQQRRGHKLDEWMSYLTYEQRAEERVIDRLARAGLVRLEEQRRLFGRTVRYVPYDSTVAGNPGNTISTAIQRGLRLSTSELFLAGLMLNTGLHQHALAIMTPTERSVLDQRISQLDVMSRELLQAVDVAVGEAAIRRR